MKSYDLLELAARNLRESILRNSLTTVGISVGIASVVSMLSLGIGLQRLASERLAKVGFNLIQVSAAESPGGGAGRSSNSADGDSRVLDEAALREISRLPGVAEAYPEIRIPAELNYDGHPIRGAVVGLPLSARTMDQYESVKGSFFSSDGAAEVLLEKALVAELLGRPAPPNPREPRNPALDASELARSIVGRNVTLRYAARVSPESEQASAGTLSVGGYSVLPRTVTVRVAGVLDLETQNRGGFGRGTIFVPLKFAQNLHAMQAADFRPNALQPALSAIIVRVVDPSQVPKVEAAVNKMGLHAFSILDALHSLKQIFGIFDLFLAVFGSLALAVSSIGIVNTLVMAILERRRQIGIMKAIGASDRDVKQIFFAEAGAMGMAGGIVGVAFGWAIGSLINFGTNVYMSRQGLPSAQIWFVPWWLVGGAIGFAVCVSLASGWYPASRASRLNPVEALRYQ